MGGNVFELFHVPEFYSWFFMQKLSLILFIILSSFILMVFIGGIFLFIIQYRKRKVEHEHEKTVMQQVHQLQLLQTQLTSQQQTMQQIGREIHDNVGQKLTLASLYTQQLAYENKAPHINDKIEGIGNIINESLAELRQLSKSLTQDAVTRNSIDQLLLQECDKINELKKCQVSFTTNQRDITLPYQLKNILLRVAQEFLQNSMKHANCSTIIVEFIKNDDNLSLNLQDDGQGFDINNLAGRGIGLSNIKKRVEMAGGEYILQSKPGNGTKLNITLPL